MHLIEDDVGVFSELLKPASIAQLRYKQLKKCSRILGRIEEKLQYVPNGTEVDVLSAAAVTLPQA